MINSEDWEEVFQLAKIQSLEGTMINTFFNSIFLERISLIPKLFLPLNPK